jgi:indolepyruvate ferredoxin oxidoreductase
MEMIVDRLDESNLSIAVQLAQAASDVRGYGPVKEISLKEYAARREQLSVQFSAATPSQRQSKSRDGREGIPAS